MKYCPSCQYQTEEDAKFCPECGAPMEDMPSDTAPVEVEPEAAPCEKPEEPAPEEAAETPAEAPEEEPAAEEPAAEEPAPAAEEPVQEPVCAVPAVTAAPAAAAAAPVPAQKDDSQLLSTFSYMMLQVLFRIPVIGIVFLFIWGAGSPKNASLKRYSASVLIWRLIGFILLLAVAIVGVIKFGAVAEKLLKAVMDAVSDTLA